MYVMGRTLWQTELSFEELVDDYFRSAFGEEGGLVRAYFEALAGFPGWGWLLKQPGDLPELEPDQVKAELDRVSGVVEGFKPVAGRNLMLRRRQPGAVVEVPAGAPGDGAANAGDH